MAFDDSLRRLYVAAESGDVTVFAYFPLQSGSNGKPQLLIMAPA